MSDSSEEADLMPSPRADPFRSPGPSARPSPYLPGASPLPSATHSPFLGHASPGSSATHSPFIGSAMPRDVDLHEQSPSREALAQAAVKAMRHRQGLRDGPPRPGRLNSGDLASEMPFSAFTTTPMGRITSMSTPVSRDLAGEPDRCMARSRLATPMSVRRRASSDLSWMEDNAQDVAQRQWHEKAASRGDGDGDSSAGPHQPQVSLSAPGWDARLCCALPGILLFGMIGSQVAIACFSRETFLATTGILTIYVFLWTTNMSIFSAVGAWRMRRDAAKNWYALSQEAREAAQAKGDVQEVMHIVILPNYKEDEEMLEETLANIAMSPMAKDCIRVVLGMEEREGPAGHEKAERLIQRTSHLFADIFAAYHPPGRIGELAGKSSNTQWAYREALRRYAEPLSRWDPSRVFLSVGDADTLWNPQYFDALSYQGYTRSAEELAWTIWQPPMLLFRNLFAVPGVTRLSGFGTLLFEVSGLANQSFCTHFCFSSYSLTLALANHRRVRGWDTDVIAEDHHMFVKCFFAPLWEQVEGEIEAKGGKSAPLVRGPAKGKVRLEPVYLPAEGYLVESSEGYWASIYARFQQARRHSQGISEMGYAALQYWRIMRHARGRAALSWTAHREALAILWKMGMIHIVNNVQAVSLLISLLLAFVGIFAKLASDGVLSCLAALASQGLHGVGSTGFSAVELARWGLFVTFGPAPPVGFISAAAIFIVVRDVIEGRYVRAPAPTAALGDEKRRSDSGDPSPTSPVAQASTALSRWQAFKLAMGMQLDMLVFAEPTILLYGMLPALMAAWSLMWRGTEFEYIVAAKPGDK